MNTEFLAQDDIIYEKMLDNSVIHSTIQSPEHSQIQKLIDAVNEQKKKIAEPNCYYILNNSKQNQTFKYIKSMKN